MIVLLSLYVSVHAYSEVHERTIVNFTHGLLGPLPIPTPNPTPHGTYVSCLSMYKGTELLVLFWLEQ